MLESTPHSIFNGFLAGIASLDSVLSVSRVDKLSNGSNFRTRNLKTYKKVYQLSVLDCKKIIITKCLLVRVVGVKFVSTVVNNDIGQLFFQVF